MFKSILAIAILALPLLASAQVTPPPIALIVKSSGGGYTPPEWSRFESCQLFRDKVVVSQSHGLADGTHVTLSHEVKITLDAGIDTLLANAAKEKEAREPNMMCDAPATTITAHVPTARKSVSLFFTGGCGSDRVEREGPASAALRNMINQFCPTTHDYRQ